MNLNDVIEKIKEQYSNHEDFEEIITDLEGNDYLDHWAKKFCDNDFDNNKELAKELFTVYADSCKDSSSFVSLADNILDEDYLNDREWAKELFEKAHLVVEDSRDLVNLASSLASKYKDLEWARTIFNEAIEKAQTSDEYQYIASTLIDEDGLGDKELAITIMKKAIEFDDITYSDAKGIGYTLFNTFDDKDWAKELYQRAIDLCDDDAERKEVIKDIKDDLEDEDWANELIEEFDITMASQATIIAPECTFYTETKKLEDVDTKEKLKDFLKEFQENADQESECCTTADSIDSFETEDGEYVDYEVEKSGRLVEEVEEDEVVFVYTYKYNDSSYEVTLNDDSSVYLETKKFGDVELIMSYTQDGEELEYEMQTAHDSDGTFVGFSSNKNGEMHTIDIVELYEECNEDEELRDETLAERIFELLEEENELEKTDFTDDDKDIDVDDLDFDNFDDTRAVLKINPRHIFSRIEDNFEDLENWEDENGHFIPEIVEFAKELTEELIDDIRAKLEGFVEERVLLGSYSSEELFEFEDGISKVNFDGLDVYFVMTKEIPQDILNALFLDITEYGFSADFVGEDGDVITQGYDEGEYDTGYFASNGADEYINASYTLKNFNKASEILLD